MFSFQTLHVSRSRKVKALRDGAALLCTYANYLFVCRQRVGQWPKWISNAMMLAAVSGRSAAGPPGPPTSQVFPSPPREI